MEPTSSKQQSGDPRVLVIEGPSEWSFFNDRGEPIQLAGVTANDPFDWATARQWGGTVEKIVIGKPTGVGDQETGLVLGDPSSEALPDDLTAAFPQLNQLYLWGVSNLRRLPALPERLQCLDIRGASSLSALPPMPPGLERLIVEGAKVLGEIPVSNGPFGSLIQMSFSGSTMLSESVVHQFLDQTPALEMLDLSGVGTLTSIRRWPARLKDIRLNDCQALATLPTEPWPDALRRLELRNVTKVAELAPFRVPESELPRADFDRLEAVLDYLDIRGTSALRELPWESLLELRRLCHRPRTLFIHESRLDVPPEVFGDKPESNVANDVFAAVAARSAEAWDHDVKVILLGNGRCGKSSLVRKLVDDDFDPHEDSTHGIRLWRHELEFTPVDGNSDERPTAGLQIWDFAGQDLYHNTHRLFLQSKAIFLLSYTDHGDGSCPETDATDDDYLPEGEDDRRLLGYWLGQIQSLGKMPGTNRTPPILVVRTKIDRDETEPRETEEDLSVVSDLERFDVSASSGHGLDRVASWLSEQVAVVLGTKGRRSLGKGRLQVKQRLQSLIEENDRAADESEKTGKRVPPPHPILSRSAFDELVRSVCPAGPDHDNPSLLLSLLHRSGFLYYRDAYLPDEIILDQRWAVNGIYGLFNRHSAAWQNLVASGGLFTLTELSEWGWTADGITSSEQQTFLRFMISCGICIEYIPASEAREPVYLAPHGLASGKLQRMQNQADEYVVDLEPQPPITVDDTKLGREAIMQLIVSLARDWRRSAVLWKWGGQFRSFAQPGATEGFTYVRINWIPTDERKEYGGILTVSLFGHDRSFLSEIAQSCQALPAFRDIDLGIDLSHSATTNQLPVGKTDLGEQVTRDSGSHSRGGHRPDLDDSLRVVALSYAGDPSPEDAKRLGTVLGGSIETWPNKLAAALALK